MNRYVIIIALLCATLTLQAAILNGYQREKIILEGEIRNVKELMLKKPDRKSARVLGKQLEKLQKQYTLVMKKYHETKELIHTMAVVDPELFLQVSGNIFWPTCLPPVVVLLR